LFEQDLSIAEKNALKFKLQENEACDQLIDVSEMVVRMMEMPLAELLDTDMEAKYARNNEYLSEELLPHIRKYWKT